MVKIKNLNFIKEILPMMIFLCSIVFACCAFIKGWNGALSDLHGFRQTQTAITVRYLLAGGPWLAYETPVLGPPWSIPMEFPLYQWLVALIVKARLFPLDQAGRFVSVVFFLLSLYPFYKILRLLNSTAGQCLLVLSLYCLSPEYLFWSRTFMIESVAMSLSLYYFWLVFLYCEATNHSQRKWSIAFAISAIGALAAAVKITTFFAFAVSGAALIGWYWLKESRSQMLWHHSTLLPIIQGGFFAGFVPLVVLILWTSYCDSIKLLNPLAHGLTSSALSEWNFGTLAQKMSPQTWKMFFFRISDLLGSSWGPVTVIIAGVFCRKERFGIAIFCLALFVLVFATFTNLHFRHNYYQYSNGLFLIAAIGIICSELWMANDYFKRSLGILFFCMIAISSLSYYMEIYWPQQGQTVNIAPIKSNLDKSMDRDDIIIVFGHDWSPELPYYLDRRAVMIQQSNQEFLNTPSFREMKRNLAGYKVGAILFCGVTQKDSALIQRVLKEFDFGKFFSSNNNNFMTIYFKK